MATGSLKKSRPAEAAARTEQKASILVIDDHPIFREGLRASIQREKDLQICFEAENAQQGLAFLKTSLPALVIIDLSLPGKQGIDLIREIHAFHPDLPVLVVSMHDESTHAERCLRAGVRGYVMKHERPEIVIAAIRDVLSGRMHVSARLAAQVLESYSTRPSHPHQSPLDSLTDREFEVFEAYGRGLTASEIGRQLHLSPKTVAVHSANIRKKLALKSIPELIRFAAQWQQTEPRM